MSQAPNPFTQAASQGYGDFAPTIDDADEDENHVDDEEQQQQQDDEVEGPQSPEPEEHETDEHGFTQTQERSYPTGIESPDEDENADQIETSDHEEEEEQQQQQQPENDEDDDDDEEAAAAGPSSPPNEEEDASNDQEEEDVEDIRKKQSRRRVQIMNDSDNEDEPQIESTSVVSKDKNRSFLNQFVTKPEHSPKKHKKRHSDEHRHHHEKKSKRFRKTSDDEENSGNEEEKEKETDNVEATSDVEDVVDDIFGKDVNENEDGDNDDKEEAAAELRDLQDDEAVQEEEDEEGADQQQQHYDAEEDDDDELAQNVKSSKGKSNIVYDIDLYLEKKAERRRGNRRRGGNRGDVIDLAGPDADKFVSKLIDQMKIATEEDRIFNKSRQPATAKLLLLPLIEQHLYRADLTEIFLDNGVLTVFKDWLSPLPDKSLPNIKIRESIIKILQQFGGINVDALRDSGIGKALMYLYKHPRETKENKIKLIKIIHDWARPIFNLDTDYKHLTREERQQRDADQASLKRQTSQTGKPKNRSADMDLPFASNKRQGNDDEMDEEDCPRARVPRPSNKDYVVRPVSTVDYSDKKGDGKKRSISRLDELKRRQQDRKRLSKPMSIVKLSIEGNKMHL
ncbi:hypothetical protein I4U23_013193 [Adineta vaga]|nr:hypothetical protein I4U23_013193 [Adineta vaga]